MHCEIWQKQKNGHNWLFYRDPVGIIRADTADQVIPALLQIENLVEEKQHTAVGFIAYEASPAFDEALVTHPNTDQPLLWFALFNSSEEVTTFPDFNSSSRYNPEQVRWRPSLSEDAYLSKVEQIYRHLERGDTYQVNLSFRMQTELALDPCSLFAQLIATQQTPLATFINCNEFSVCSASPELFFELDGHTIITRPMKGTHARGRTQQEDLQYRQHLASSEKDRAENVMIVDMIRNDLARIADPGSVMPGPLFTVEKYPTIWQMTSTVCAHTERSVTDIFRALFPCASITGAPKSRTMKIIKELEDSPRGIYTGAIGSIAPDRSAHFNVAIRTAFLTHAEGEYGIGSGVIWDSNSENEYAECLLKSKILHTPGNDFQLLETLRWDPGQGYFLLELHLLRLLESAAYFDVSISKDEISTALRCYEQKLKGSTQKVRLLLSLTGELHLEHTRMEILSNPVRLRLAKSPMNPDNTFLYHKTTGRELYSIAASDTMTPEELPLFWNNQGQITESSIANVVINRNGELLTPPVSCGLLPGTYRSFLMDQGLIREAIIEKDSIRPDTQISLINSVREWIPAILVNTEDEMLPATSSAENSTSPRHV